MNLVDSLGKEVRMPRCGTMGKTHPNKVDSRIKHLSGTGPW
ncbi:hypothetical protein D187_009626 [Cystobacter fuscus DSM 2262]|uniref:Uncharacterized protein n=1 Tax=Cystobacter fuscus (strain ATCC 25194 / DSM 2262 / NBRC 100088 / M29) TaxID=1242864 RepID=S9NSR4_CYSF2|nr:hypothetical protein D187_009626 [Cystobacter fuscus DSM 2262]